MDEKQIKEYLKNNLSINVEVHSEYNWNNETFKIDRIIVQLILDEEIISESNDYPS